MSQSQGRIVRLGDLADVRDATEEPRSSAQYNDEEAVGIEILKSTGFSTTAVGEEIRRRVVEIQKTLPAGVTLRIVQDAECASRLGLRSGGANRGCRAAVVVVFL